MKLRTSLLALLLVLTSTVWGQDSGGIDIRIRPVIGYAQFANSNFIGDTGTAKVRLKTEDVVLGVAASASRTWGKWRGELEYTWRYRTDLNGYAYYDHYDLRIRSNIENQTLAVNIFRFFEPYDHLQAFAVAGIGIALNQSQANFSDSRTPLLAEDRSHLERNLMWNVGAGATLHVSQHWAVDLGYRYVHLGQATTPMFSSGFALSTGDLSSHDITLTLRRGFGAN